MAKFDEVAAVKIIQGVGLGQTWEQSCIGSGVSFATFLQWIKLADTAALEPFQAFAAQIRQAGQKATDRGLLLLRRNYPIASDGTVINTALYQ